MPRALKMKISVLVFFVILISTPLRAAVVKGEVGSLVYSDGVDGDFNSLVYENKSGPILRVFDEGLNFNYDSRYDSGSMSPGKTHSVVHFSETGYGLQQKSETRYLCAFVRMSDGCIVNVEAGDDCDGQWSESERWISSSGNVRDDFLKNAITSSEVYENYRSGIRDSTRVSTPRILAYLSEGTAFDNLLACDPPGLGNMETYTAMLRLLTRDGDTENSEKLTRAIQK